MNRSIVQITVALVVMLNALVLPAEEGIGESVVAGPVLFEPSARDRVRRAGKGSISQQRRAEYDDMIREESRRQGVSANLVHAMVAAESAYDSDAKSHAGAVGLMQLMPATAARYGVKDRSDPRENLRGGVSYLRDLMTLYRGDLSKAVAAYNAGEAAIEKYGGIPPYPETQAFVFRVLGRVRRPNAGCWRWTAEIESRSWGRRCVSKIPKKFEVEIGGELSR